jgi:hypothetical protein
MNEEAKTRVGSQGQRKKKKPSVTRASKLMTAVNEILAIKCGTLELEETENSTHVRFVVEEVPDLQSLISGFRREVDEVCALMGCYAASSVNSLPTFRYKLSSSSSRVNKSFS